MHITDHDPRFMTRFDPQELRAYVLTAAERHNPIDVDKLVHEVMQQPKRKGRGAG
jgi:hypothetical protein